MWVNNFAQKYKKIFVYPSFPPTFIPPNSIKKETRDEAETKLIKKERPSPLQWEDKF